MSSHKNGLAYVQHPTIRGDRIAFAAEGDIWEVATTGGTARRLTSTPATASFPRYSPDGAWLAFSSADEGPSAIWVMPADGGTAKRLTFNALPAAVVGWTADSSRVVFRTVWEEGVRANTLASVHVDGGAMRHEKFGRAEGAAYHADGVRVAVHRHMADPAWWKRYAGGRAGVLWVGNVETGEFTKVPGGERSDASPMWIGDALWFLSDEDGQGDIWRADADGGNRRRVTSHKEFYARWPQSDGSRIVYSMGGALFLLDTESETPTPREVDVRVLGHSLSDRRKFVDVTKSLQAFAANHDGSEALFTVRGRIVRLPCWHGAAQVVAAVDGVRFREACWLGEEHVAAIAHVDGEDRVVVLPGGGIGGDLSTARDLGTVGRRVRSLVPSPDGRRIAVLDHGRGLHVLTLAEDGGTATCDVVDDEGQMWVRDAAWSPCSTWLAWSRATSWWTSRMLVWNATSGETHSISSAEFSDFGPSWDPAGRFLAFLSSRHLNPYYSELEHDFGFTAATRAFVLPLTKDAGVPFAPEARAPEEPPERATDPIEIDFDAIAERAYPLPFEAGRYARIGCSTDAVAVLRQPLVGAMELMKPDWESPDAAHNCVLVFPLSERKVEPAIEKATDWCVSGDGSKWLYRIGRRFRMLPGAKKPNGMPEFLKKKEDDHCSPKTGWIDLGRIALSVEPRGEFRQMLHEAWALQRDHFYDPGLAGVDWDACLRRYLPLVDRVRTREELIDLLWEMQGELGTSHAYAMGGDIPAGRNYATGQLGCDFEQDEASGRYRFARIFRGDVWAEKRHSPLAEPGKNVREGQYLLAVDGRPCGRDAHPGQCLLETAGKQVVLTIADDPQGAARRDVTVTPIAQDWYLRYRDWVDRNQAYVDEATDGRIGYVHIPNMQLDGAMEFHRAFLWQAPLKRGFVIDNRFNGGGNISAILLAKLTKPIVGWTFTRHGEPRTYPRNAPRGPIVVLTNENAGSDGDIFSRAVKSVGLGPLIGMRTWGGVVGIDMAKDLVDGGLTTQPEYAFWFPETGWSVENHGVEPDIEVDRTPGDAFHGRDPQLDRAIHEVLTALETAPPAPPDPGPKPDLRFRP